MKSLLVFILISVFTGTLCGNDSDFTQWWIENYGDYTGTIGKHDPRVKWAREVFGKVRGVADKGDSLMPRLYIINTGKQPYAQAIPDGGIIINPYTLDICYKEMTREEGDVRLAFILGHELAHLANKDFMHQEAFQTLQQYGQESTKRKFSEYFQFPNQEEEKLNKKKELFADRSGAIYAAMAGYNLSTLFLVKNSFLRFWAKQAGVGYAYDGNLHHPSFEKREQFLRTQLIALINRIELFKAGVLLLQMDSFHDSEASFQEFARMYPSREVLNNIGLCNLNLALNHLFLKYKDEYLHFRFSTTVDYSSTAEALLPRGEGNYLKDTDISRYLNKAEEFFKFAVDHDMHNITSRHNLAVVYILKKEFARAQAVCDFILKIAPNDVKALSNKAIAFYCYGKAEDLDTTQKSIQLLEKARQIAPDSFEVLYNLAALKQARNRLAGARQFWEKYLKLSTTPKDNYYNHIYQKVNGVLPPLSSSKLTIPSIPSGIYLGEKFDTIEKKWGKGLKREFKLGNTQQGDNAKENWAINLQIIVINNVRVIALDGIVELVEQEGVPIETTQDILNRFGSPQKVIRMSDGNFFVYKDQGFSIKIIDGKVRSYIWFEKGF